MKTWIQTFQGRKLEPRFLKPEAVGNIAEIAHCLAGEFRFTRQTARRYSVAEHCVRGSRLLPPVFAGPFLLHELSEVYLPDIAGPLKPSLRVVVPEGFPGRMTNFDGTVSWTALERQHTSTILETLGLSSLEPLIYSPEVKAMDLAMLAAEKRDLLGPEPEDWGLTVEPAAVDVTRPWAVDQARDFFLARYSELFQVT